MNYSQIEARRFVTDDGKAFAINDFDYIKNYISKYPSARRGRPQDFRGFRFFTMRDINALKRSRTFIAEDTANTIYVDPKKLEYYCYVDTFKDIIDRLPYYLGNFDVMFDKEAFEPIKNTFLISSAAKHPDLFSSLKGSFSRADVLRARETIGGYFQNLLGGHRVQNR